MKLIIIFIDMAVNTFASTLLGKLKKFGKNQKDSIRENLCTQGELPLLVQIFGAVFIWFLLFIVFMTMITPSQRWIIALVAVIVAFGFIQGLNFIGQKLVLKEFREEEFPEINSLDLTNNSILIGDEFQQGALVLSQKVRGRYHLTPIVALKIDSISSSTSSIFSSISNITLQKLSLKYHCSIIDTAKYEVLLLKGQPKSSKHTSLFITLQILEETFFQQVFDTLTEFTREKKISFEKLDESVLKEIFPLYENVLHVSQNREEIQNIPESVDIIDSDPDDQDDRDERFVEFLVKENSKDSTEETVTVKEQSNVIILDKVDEKQSIGSELVNQESDSNQKDMIKNILLGELNFSIDSFLSAARGYYKKAIETALETKYKANAERFLKTVHLYCERENIPFYYPSYSYLLKIVEFLDIELPSSTEIENFVDRLSEEYTSISIDDENKQKLSTFLESKFKDSLDNSKESVKNLDEAADISSIPQPPAARNTNKELLIDGGD